MRAVALIVVLGLVAFASGIKIFNQNEALTLACCGSNSYDTTTQFCCIDNIFRNDDSDTNLCCGRNRLGNDKQCCSALDGVVSVNDKQISSSQTCCGTTGYDPSNQLCCAPNRVLNNKDGNLQCCGNDRTYDPSRDLCCSTVRIRDRGNCEDAEVDVNFNVISNGANDGKQCCGSSAFNPSTQLCCGGTDDARVVSNGNDNNLQCCGSSSYDPSRQTCCQVESSQDFTVDGQTVTVTFTRGNVAGNANLQCCDDGSLNAFDPATQICCAGNVQRQNSDNSLACCGSRTFNTLTQTCCSREVAKFKRVKGCCGSCDTFVAVTETEFNIGSPANAQCCDNRPYDDTKNICCKDNIIRQNDDNSLQCCGSDAYNTNRDICCTDESQEHGRVFRDRLNDDVTYDCCLNTDASECNVKYNFDIFDTAKKSCPCGKVIDQRDDLSLNNNNPNVQAGCCGTTQIDVNSKTCCAKAIHDVDPAIGFKCCNDDGKTLYNPGYQVCCGGKSAGCSVPCGAKKTRDVEETESSEEVEAKDEDKKKKKKSDNNRSKVQCGDSCCGKEGYFAAYQKCCDGKILDFNSAAAGSSPMTCCGDEIYNSNFRNCCIDTRIKSIGRCGIKGSVDHAIFDADTQICCGSGVVTVA